MQHPSNTFERFLPAWVLIMLASVMVNMALVFVFGISDGGDSGRYYGGAQSLLAGEFPGGKGRSYLGYILFVTPFVALGLGNVAIGIAQIFLSSVAAVCLYLLGTKLYGRKAGVLAAALYISFPDIQYWNLIVYADSVFSSMLIISCYLLLTAKGGPRVSIAIFAAIYTCTVRPHGVGFAAAILAFGLYLLWVNRNYKPLFILGFGVAASTPIWWDMLGTMVGYERVLEIYASGEVIWGYQGNALTMPGGISNSTQDIDHSIIAIWSFVIEKPVYFFTLLATKLGYLFAHTRPYFSAFHNALSLVFLVPAYLFSLFGLPVHSQHQRPARFLLLSTVVFLGTISAFTFVDWDGRFLIPLLFVVFLFAGSGFWRIYDGWHRRFRPT